MRFGIILTAAVVTATSACSATPVFAPIVEAPEYCPGATSAGTETHVKVITLNLRHHSDEWERRFELIADELVRLDADVIGLQEVSMTANQGPYLNEVLKKRGRAPYELVVEPYAGFGGTQGVAIMSRWPIEAHASAPVGDGRIALFARVRHPSGAAVEVVNTHLDAHRDDEGDMKRDQEIVQLLAMLEKHDDCHPTILTGDMNSTDDSHAATRIRAARFEDSWSKANPGAPGNTGMIKLQNGAFDQSPRRRIDFIYTRAAGARRLTPSASEVVFKNHDAQGFYPSDHLGVLTVFDARL